MTVSTGNDEVYLLEDVNSVRKALNNLSDCVWVFHDAKFDVQHLRSIADVPKRSRLWDTYLIDRLLWNNYYDLFALKHLARRYLGILVDKTVREDFATAVALTDTMRTYACYDADITAKIAQCQRKDFTSTDMNLWKIDRDAMWAMCDFMGFRIDKDRWLNVARKNLQKASDIKKQLSFNPHSSTEVVKALRRLGIASISNSKKETLEKLLDTVSDAHILQMLQLVVDARKYAKYASIYGEDFLNKYVETIDGVDVIIADYNVTGAITGRTSCSAPNMQNIPIKDTNIFRECFIARPGNKLIIADYSAQEPAILAVLAKDEKLIDVFQSGSDVYIEIARLVFGKTITKSDPLRQVIKSVFLGLNYGMSASGLAKKLQITSDEAQNILNKFYKTFPDVHSWQAKQRRLKSYAISMLGRKVWLNPYSNQVSQWVLNAPIQSTAAEMMKKALATIHKEWNFDYPFACVGYIHDEVVFDVPEHLADTAAKFIKTTMEEISLQITGAIRIKADTKMGNSWADKK